jgi:hypothetical protein
MKKTIATEALVSSIADMVLANSISNNKDSVMKLEEILSFDIKGALMTEILLAEIFVGQMVVLDFFKKKNHDIQKIDYYYRNVYQLLVDKYHYFNKENLVFFERLIQSRYPEYFEATKKEDSVAKTLTALISKNFSINNAIFSNVLVGLFTNIVTTLSDFLKGCDEKFKLS